MVRRKDSARDLLSLIESHYDAGALDRAAQEIGRARELFPEDLTFVEWEAALAADENRLKDALELLRRVLTLEPGRTFARRECAGVFLGLGRFEEALEIYSEIGPERPSDATYYFDVGHCLDRLGKRPQARKYFERAASLDPEGFKAPVEYEREEFLDLIEEALDDLPSELEDHLGDVDIFLDDYPGPLEDDPFALVIFGKGPRTVGGGRRSRIRDRLVVFKRSLEIEFADGETLREELFRAISEEISRAFGIEDDTEPD